MGLSVFTFVSQSYRVALHPKSTIDHRLRLLHDALQMVLATEAFGIDLVDVFGS